MLDKNGEDKLAEKTGSRQTKYTREVGQIHTGEAHQDGAEHHHGGKTDKSRKGI